VAHYYNGNNPSWVRGQNWLGLAVALFGKRVCNAIAFAPVQLFCQR
jgi:hypothetical protein